MDFKRVIGRRWVLLVLVFFLIADSLSGLARASSGDDTVTFTDKNLEKAIRQEISKPSGAIYKSDLEVITQLFLGSSNIKSLSGIENLPNLAFAEFSSNQITDITPLASLEALSGLFLNNNKISKLPKMDKLKNLKQLELGNNQIKDLTNLSSLKGASDLQSLVLSGNGISNPAAVSSVSQVEFLNLGNNKLTTLPDLSNFKNLNQLFLYKNQLTSLGGLKNMPKLKELDISENQLTNITSLAPMKHLTSIDLSKNKLKDVSALSSLENLSILKLSGNPIATYNPLKGIYRNLTEMDFSMPLPNVTVSHSTNSIVPTSANKEPKAIDNYWELSTHLHPKANLTFTDKEVAEVYYKVKKIVSQTLKPGMTDFQKVLALHDYLVDSVEYDVDTYFQGKDSPHSYTPYGSLIKGLAVCDGYSRAMDLLLKAAGFKTYWITGDVKNFGWEGHSWNLVYLNGQYYHIDTTWNDPISMSGKNLGIKRYHYFLLSDEQINRDHRWENKDFPKATSTKWTPLRNILNQETILAGSRQGDWIYFRNDWDGQKLYKIKVDGTGEKKLSNDVAVDVAVDGDWVYYSKDYTGSYLTKIKTDGTGKKVLNSDLTANIKPYGEWVFYLNIQDHNIYKVKKDGTKRTKVSNTKVYQLNKVEKNWIYFLNFNNEPYKMKLDGSGLQKM
ncbi:leucine-rich repeat domain-containing protein [Pseudoneobacillus sp. C159]